MVNQKQHEIWLFRHGQTAWSLTGQHTGCTDLPLTEAGKQQAEALGRYLAGRKFVWYYPALSPAPPRRAGWRDGEVARFTDDLMEWDYGKYEGLRPDDILEKRPGWTFGKTASQRERRPSKLVSGQRRSS